MIFSSPSLILLWRKYGYLLTHAIIIFRNLILESRNFVRSSQPAFTFSKSTIETPEKWVNYWKLTNIPERRHWRTSVFTVNALQVSFTVNFEHIAHIVDFECWFRMISKVGFEQVNSGWVMSVFFVKENKGQQNP